MSRKWSQDEVPQMRKTWTKPRPPDAAPTLAYVDLSEHKRTRELPSFKNLLEKSNWLPGRVCIACSDKQGEVVGGERMDPSEISVLCKCSMCTERGRRMAASRLVPHEQWARLMTLEAFLEHGLNVTIIERSPSRGRLPDYVPLALCLTYINVVDQSRSSVKSLGDWVKDQLNQFEALDMLIKKKVYVYWYGQNADNGRVGCWYPAEVLSICRGTGLITIQYEDADGKDENGVDVYVPRTVALGLCFLHWGKTPPALPSNTWKPKGIPKAALGFRPHRQVSSNSDQHQRSLPHEAEQQSAERQGEQAAEQQHSQGQQQGNEQRVGRPAVEAPRGGVRAHTRLPSSSGESGGSTNDVVSSDHDDCAYISRAPRAQHRPAIDLTQQDMPVTRRATPGLAPAAPPAAQGPLTSRGPRGDNTSRLGGGRKATAVPAPAKAVASAIAGKPTAAGAVGPAAATAAPAATPSQAKAAAPNLAARAQGQAPAAAEPATAARAQPTAVKRVATPTIAMATGTTQHQGISDPVRSGAMAKVPPAAKTVCTVETEAGASGRQQQLSTQLQSSPPGPGAGSSAAVLAVEAPAGHAVDLAKRKRKQGSTAAKVKAVAAQPTAGHAEGAKAAVLKPPASSAAARGVRAGSVALQGAPASVVVQDGSSESASDSDDAGLPHQRSKSPDVVIEVSDPFARVPARSLGLPACGKALSPGTGPAIRVQGAQATAGVASAMAGGAPAAATQPGGGLPHSGVKRGRNGEAGVHLAPSGKAEVQVFDRGQVSDRGQVPDRGQAARVGGASSRAVPGVSSEAKVLAAGIGKSVLLPPHDGTTADDSLDGDIAMEDVDAAVEMAQCIHPHSPAQFARVALPAPQAATSALPKQPANMGHSDMRDNGEATARDGRRAHDASATPGAAAALPQNMLQATAGVPAGKRRKRAGSKDVTVKAGKLAKHESTPPMSTAPVSATPASNPVSKPSATAVPAARAVHLGQSPTPAACATATAALAAVPAPAACTPTQPLQGSLKQISTAPVSNQGMALFPHASSELPLVVPSEDEVNAAAARHLLDMVDAATAGRVLFYLQAATRYKQLCGGLADAGEALNSDHVPQLEEREIAAAAGAEDVESGAGEDVAAAQQETTDVLLVSREEAEQHKRVDAEEARRESDVQALIFALNLKLQQDTTDPGSSTSTAAATVGVWDQLQAVMPQSQTSPWACPPPLPLLVECVRKCLELLDAPPVCIQHALRSCRLSHTQAVLSFDLLQRAVKQRSVEWCVRVLDELALSTWSRFLRAFMTN